MNVDINSALKEIEQEIHKLNVRKEKIQRLQNVLDKEIISETEYHELCETPLRYTDLLGKLVCNALPCLTYESYSLNYFHYLANDWQVRIPNSRCSGIEIVLPYYGVKNRCECNSQNFSRTLKLGSTKDKIRKIERFLASDSILEKALLAEPASVSQLVKYIIDWIFKGKRYKRDMTSRLIDLKEKASSLESELNKTYRIYLSNVQKIYLALQEILPEMLEWTDKVRIYTKKDCNSKALFEFTKENYKESEVFSHKFPT